MTYYLTFDYVRAIGAELVLLGAIAILPALARARPAWPVWLGRAALVGAAAVALALAPGVAGEAFSRQLAFDRWAAVGAAGVALAALVSLGHDPRSVAAALWRAFGGVLLASANDLVMVIVASEMMLLARDDDETLLREIAVVAYRVALLAAAVIFAGRLATTELPTVLRAVTAESGGFRLGALCYAAAVFAAAGATLAPRRKTASLVWCAAMGAHLGRAALVLAASGWVLG